VIDEIPAPLFADAPPTGSTAPQTFERWAIRVLRPDGTIEVLGTIYRTELEARTQAEYFAREWKLVTIKPAKCRIEVST